MAGVERFAKGEEIYCGFASKVLGYPVRKPRKEGGIPAIEKRMGWARNSIGKVGILGCGYGMGQDRIMDYAKGAVDAETALKIRDVYRSENAEIVKFWYAIEKAFVQVVKYGTPARLPQGLSFSQYEDCDVVITLPNGRELHYLQVRLHPNPEVFNQQTHSWEHLWGGTLAENVVQAMARDVLVEAMLRLEDNGIHTALTVHDELVIVAPDAVADAVLQESIVELSRTPVWAPRMPLAAEGKVCKCYQK